MKVIKCNQSGQDSLDRIADDLFRIVDRLTDMADYYFDENGWDEINKAIDFADRAHGKVMDAISMIPEYR